MKITCEKNDLLAGLSTVQRALSARSTLPALEGVLFRCVRGAVQLTAFDMVLAIESVIQAEIREEGEMLLPGRLLTEVIRKMPDGPVKIEVEKNQAVISAENTQTAVSLMNIEEYPALPEIREGVRITLPQNILRNLVERTSFAVAIDESRPILNGIKLEIRPESLKAVALDGYRMAIAKLPVRTNLEMDVVVPGHSLAEVAKLLTEEESIDIFVEKKYVLFDLGHTRLTSRLLEGEYIRYESIIPAEFITEVTVNRQLMADSVDRASLIARENKTNVIIMRAKENKMIITARAETGNAYEELPASVFGKEIEIAFNAKYILDYLKAAEDEFVTFYFKSNLSPAVIKCVDKKDEDDLYLILPVRM